MPESPCEYRALRRWSATAAVALICALAGCALPPWHSASEGVPAALRTLASPAQRPDFVLLGEVHDHPQHHEMRARWLAELARETRFAIAMEQFDASRQADIDRARAQGLSARALAQAAGFEFGGWEWEHYGPFVELALREGLPLAGANLSRAEGLRIARGQPHPLGGIEPSGWGETERSAMAAGIRDGHCGMLPERSIAPMASAQRARDAQMAQVMDRVRRDTGLPVVLIAGNGHVRSDLGVPRYLRDLMPQSRILVIGLLEEGSSRPSGAYDVQIVTAPKQRPDPCEGLRRQFEKRPPAGQTAAASPQAVARLPR